MRHFAPGLAMLCALLVQLLKRKRKASICAPTPKGARSSPIPTRPVARHSTSPMASRCLSTAPGCRRAQGPGHQPVRLPQGQ
ncbi:hypothetical protein LP420_10690 [Massilia sp. B-10]|nr:hypothetical protein LP420_10690 [Massilia sp. B-10]UUZ55819.1 hypothetical protein LP419_10135 [Massilia sp. H-1]